MMPSSKNFIELNDEGGDIHISNFYCSFSFLSCILCGNNEYRIKMACEDFENKRIGEGFLKVLDNIIHATFILVNGSFFFNAVKTVKGYSSKEPSDEDSYINIDDDDIVPNDSNGDESKRNSIMSNELKNNYNISNEESGVIIGNGQNEANMVLSQQEGIVQIYNAQEDYIDIC